MATQPSTHLQRKLRQYQQQYAELKKQIRPLGFICSGTLVQRRVTCGNPRCPCSRDPLLLHGPYYQLSWKEKGKSVSRFLSPEEVALYREWTDNRKKLSVITDKMHAISEKVRNCLLPQKAVERKHPARSRKSQRHKRPS
jgi:hypothetical protein